jgi:hypothetical protein
MKILIANDGFHAHYYERLGWTNAFRAAGIECRMYDCKTTPAFPIYDSYEPDIFIGQLYNLDRATLKCIQSRPHLKVALRAGEFSTFSHVNLNILSVTNEELGQLKLLRESTGGPNFIYSHYLQHDIEKTHKNFYDYFGIKLVGIPMGADVHTYYQGSYNSTLACDLAFVGGYWPYKAQILDFFLLPLLSEFKYSAKIFGNQPWPCNQYCGMIEDSLVGDLFASAKICPNLSEPHAHTLGVDLNERAFKILAAGGFCIMDNVRAAREVFGGGIVFADSPSDFKEKVDYYLTRPDERAKIAKLGHDIVMAGHTNYHRAALFLQSFNEPQAAQQVMNAFHNSFL